MNEEKKNKGAMRSPNELFEAAKKYQLDGREPESETDWVDVVNFWARNIVSEVGPAAIQLMGRLYKCPLSDEDIANIHQYQWDSKKEEGIE